MTERTVTLVVCDEGGDVLGEIEPFDVDTPWWQDVEPIGLRYPSLQVLRLLHATPRPDVVAGGEVRYLAEAREGTRGLSLTTCGDVLDDHPLRMPWARPGGPAADLAWAAEFVELSGPPVQHRTWNLSSIWSMPTRRGTVWLKCVPGFFFHEAAVLRLIAGRGAPELIASDRHRILLEELPGRDGFGASVDDSRRLIDHLVDLQSATQPVILEFLHAGIPDNRWTVLLDELTAVVRRRTPLDAHLERLLDEADRLKAAIDDCGLGDVLVHGDAHPGNARLGTDPPVWFDWGDSRIGHPLLDLAVLGRLPDSGRKPLEQHWLAAWARTVPGSDPSTAWQFLRPFAALREAAVYQGFLDNIEPSERVYHVDDVMPALTTASALAAATPGRP